MRKLVIPLALVAGAVAVWLLLRQVDKAKENRRDIVDETLEGF